MIEIRLEKDQAILRSIRISGHAFYDEKGKDLVCAAISAIGIGACNAIDSLIRDKQSYYIEINDHIPLILIEQKKKNEPLQLLLQALFIELETVAQSYPRYVSILTD